MKRIAIISVIAAVLYLTLYYMSLWSQEDHYNNVDIFNGSYCYEDSIENGIVNLPPDFFISIGSPLSDYESILEMKNTEEPDIDCDAENWMFDLRSSKIYLVERGNDEISIIENGEVTGHINICYSRFLWKKYNVKYTIAWKSEEHVIERVSPVLIM